MNDDFYPYDFRWDIAGRKGQRCRVLARSRPARGELPNPAGAIPVRKVWNSVLIEFDDRFKMVTSGNAIRKCKIETAQ